MLLRRRETSAGDEVPSRSGRLFRKYVLLFVVIVSATLIVSSALEVFFTYREQLASLGRVQRAESQVAADQVARFVAELDEQLLVIANEPWQSPDLLDDRRVASLRLVSRFPAITTLILLDSAGQEQLKLAQLALAAGQVFPLVTTGSGADHSSRADYIGALANGSYRGQVRVGRGLDPYLSQGVRADQPKDGVTVADYNLAPLRAFLAQPASGSALYIVDEHGRIILHSSPAVSVGEERGRLPQVASATTASAASGIGRTLSGDRVASASARVDELGWAVVAELPWAAVLGPIRSSILRIAVLFVGGLVAAVGAGLFLARRMTGPIRELHRGAVQIGRGEMTQRLTIRTGDELEDLADQFNQMAAALQRSYSDLERKVSVRTEELERSVAQLKALDEVSSTISSTLDSQRVLTTIVGKAVELSDADSGAVLERDPLGGFRVSAQCGEMPDPNVPARVDVVSRRPGHPSDALAQAEAQSFSATEIDGVPAYSLLIIPLTSGGELVGRLVLRKKGSRAFSSANTEILRTFASQSVIAIENARLFSALARKTEELEISSQHKSQFLANMSHEFRTPLNAILGYAELVRDSIYGPIPERLRGAVERIIVNGNHLLRLISDVLDLSKIEAGAITLALETYSIVELVQAAIVSLTPMADSKGLVLSQQVLGVIPHLLGDPIRITQVILNLISNALKFTELGTVDVVITSSDGFVELSVADTGPGIPPHDHERVFQQFQQIDNSITRRQGGAGLGLAISRSIVSLHRGTIGIRSDVGTGSTFWIRLPVRASEGRRGEAGQVV